MFKSRQQPKELFLLLIGFVLVACSTATPTEPASQRYERAANAVEATEEKLTAFRHDLHQYPELSGEERRTSEKVAAELERLGYSVKTNVGGYGVVALLEGASPGPLIAFRADMDAVRDNNVDPVPYASKIPGVRHICGHDVHTTIGIGLAAGFAEIRDTLPGSVMLIFQPAEEAGIGAELMLSDGLFSKLKPDAILAVHTAPMNLGELAVSPNGMMAGRALVTVTLQGSGDLDEAASRVRNALQSVSDVEGSQMLAFQPSEVVAVDVFGSADAPDAETLKVKAFVMSAGLERRGAVKERVFSALSAVDLDGVEMNIAYEQALEGVNNEPAIMTMASQGIAKFEPDLVIEEWPGVIPMFSEDFGSMQREVPGVMFFLGVSNPEKGTIGFPHAPNYVADDAAIILGTKAMLAASLTLMEDGITRSAE